MSAQTIESAKHFQNFRQQLSLFGLNPLEWRLFSRSEHPNTFELRHREDPAFRINVQTRALRSGLLRVDRLSVVSL